MAKTQTHTPGRSGPPTLFHDKVLARRSAVLTRRGNVALDAFRARIGKALGFKRPISIGDAVELLVHYEAKLEIEADELRDIPARINRLTAEDR